MKLLVRETQVQILSIQRDTILHYVIADFLPWNCGRIRILPREWRKCTPTWHQWSRFPLAKDFLGRKWLTNRMPAPEALRWQGRRCWQRWCRSGGRRTRRVRSWGRQRRHLRRFLHRRGDRDFSQEGLNLLFSRQLRISNKREEGNQIAFLPVTCHKFSLYLSFWAKDFAQPICSTTIQ